MAQHTEVSSSKKETKKEENEFTLSQLLFDWLGTLLMAIVVILLVMTFFLRQITVKGHSMDDTLQTQDRLVVASFMYEPKNGDIVVVSHGESYNEPIIKRVIATEGQRLQINYENDEVIVDGVVLKEDYIKGRTIKLQNPTAIPDVIPKGYVFVMGDNREDSLDSRSTRIGLIPVENIIGKAFWRVQPFDTFGSLY